MGTQIDFHGLGQVLLSRARELLAEWLPGGKPDGAEYCCGSLQGGPGKSCKVNIKSGKWADFATGESGGDFISLFAAVQRIKQGEAAKILADRYQYNAHKYAALSAPEPEPNDIVAPPLEAPIPNMEHFKHGKATAFWAYEGLEGERLFFVARYDPKDGKKEFIPWAYSASRARFINKAWPDPRPLYNLAELKNRPDAPVLLVEGEKAADAAHKIAGHVYVVMSWPGGSQAWRKVDYAPIYGRKILLWPDADNSAVYPRGHKKAGEVKPYPEQPGPAAMFSIAGLLHRHCPEIKIINVSEMNDGWDAADALALGWKMKEFAAFAKPRVSVYAPLPIEPEIMPDPPEMESGPEEPPPIQDADLPAVKGSQAMLYLELGVATTKQGFPIINLNNVSKVLRAFEPFKDLVWFDEFHQKLLTRRGFNGEIREWRDQDDLELTDLYQGDLGFQKITPNLINDAVRMFAGQNVRNEPLDWMNSLKWDEYPRIEEFFGECFGAADNEYTRAASKNWWISMAARILKPGCKVDNMVILEGGQGKFKSTALGIIGGPWFAEVSERPDSKDFFQLLQGKLLIEIGELDSFSKAETTTIKNMVSRQTDRFRAPYAKAPADNPRRCVFVGTTNEDDYLRDHTGARRFWPVRVENINLDLIRERREQLFAEAVHRFKNGESWYEMPRDAALEEQEARRQGDAWEDAVGEFLIGKVETTVKDVAAHLKIDLGKLDTLTQRRIARVLKLLGWRSHNLRRVGRQMRVWVSKDSIV